MSGNLDHIPGSDSHVELLRLLRDPFAFLSERHARHGNVFKTRWVLPGVFVVGSEANRLLMVSARYETGLNRMPFGRLFENSILLMDGPEHHRARGILQPAVGRLALKSSLARVQRIWSHHAEHKADGTYYDAYRLARDITFEVSANALLELELQEELATFRSLFDTMVGGIMAIPPVRFPFGRLDRALKAREALMRMLSRSIEAARAGASDDGMLARLARHRDPDGHLLSTREIAEHVLLLFWAGYDTTASTITWIMHQLVREPRWQERLHAEQQRVLGERAFDLDDVQALEQQGWFLKEIERMHPVVPLMGPRHLIEPLEVEGIRIPAGTLMYYSAYLTHRDPALFDDPERFDPTRWDPTRGDQQARTRALIGFGSSGSCSRPCWADITSSPAPVSRGCARYLSAASTACSSGFGVAMGCPCAQQRNSSSPARS